MEGCNNKNMERHHLLPENEEMSPKQRCLEDDSFPFKTCSRILGDIRSFSVG